ncbi:MAG TPA: NUDIX domain-containing protein [Candidatus Nitrosotenuis sp.]|nr:NUDIX domain-containing protein [Candidatus Nitrosotenuis sp.]HIH68850.1 NUDIX domain-containing protein [Candidatus Nitrosotenuis sp.]
MMQETFERSAGIILYRESAMKKFFLLLHYPSGHWDFVKGRIEKNENEKQAAIRETQEETGITDVEFIDGFEEKIHYTYQFFGKIVQKEVVFFLGKTKTEEIKLSDEHLDHIWLEFDDAFSKTTYQNAKSLLQKSKPLIFR